MTDQPDPPASTVRTEEESKRTSLLVLLAFTPSWWMFFGGAETAARGAGWLAVNRFGLACVVFAGTLLGLPLFGEEGGALVRWDQSVLALQRRVLHWAGRTALRVLRWALALAALIVLIVVDAAIGHWSGGALGSRGFFLALFWAFAVLIIVSVLAVAGWLLSRKPRVEGLQFTDLFEFGFKQPRRDITVGLAIAIFLVGSLLQYLALGHESQSPTKSRASAAVAVILVVPARGASYRPLAPTWPAPRERWPRPKQ